MVRDPFDLNDAAAYAAWRASKRSAYPAAVDDLRVSVARLGAPAPHETASLAARIRTFNMALVCTDPDQIQPSAILDFGRALGLHRTDANQFADAQAVSTITAGGTDDRSEYIPYTTRPLSWHTDGYYNPAARQIRAWTLFCLRPARSGGENTLLDHDLAYIALRDQSPDHIAALSHPEALRIPANVQEGRTLRPESLGPVFSVCGGALRMRYSARARNAQWRADGATQAARAALDRLFSQPSIYTFSHRLKAGEGLISNNVLHNRTAFEDETDSGNGRLLYRVRYLDPVGV